jgi:broad specificity phosphatase PhoE
MSRLLLIRHGQASFHGNDYDQLSQRGRAQAQALGAWLLQAGERIDAVYVGTKRRQRQTHENVAQALAEAGRPLPPARVLPELDEVKFETIVRALVKERHADHEELQRLGRAYVATADPEEKPVAFTRLARAVAHVWLDETEPIEGSELWPEFRQRVLAGFEQIRAETGRGKTAAAFTSAGPISAMVQHALGCDSPTIIRMWWKLANASLTELLFTETELTLKVYNALPHLPDPRQWTYL